jgi:predicted ArsR family transcriptional regulator
MHKLMNEDCDRILRCLHNGPKTAKEVADAIRMPRLRANHLMIYLAKQGLIYAHHCTPNATGLPVNVWALRPCCERLPTSRDVTLRP